MGAYLESQETIQNDIAESMNFFDPKMIFGDYDDILSQIVEKENMNSNDLIVRSNHDEEQCIVVATWFIIYEPYALVEKM